MAPKRKKTDAAADEEDTMDWASLTVANLKAELVERGLPVSGNKAALVSRLNAAEGAVQADARLDRSGMTVAQLKAELSNRSLPVSGNKTTLLKRLDDADIFPAKPKKARSTALQQSIHDAPAPATAAGNSTSAGEKRLRPFVETPDAEYAKKLKKVQTERLFMLDRKKGIDKHGIVCEEFDIAGSTGNVYQTTIGREPRCVCMDARIRGQKCKHIKYALIIILKAPAHLCYQVAFLSSELESIFANAPVTRAPELDHKHNHADDETMYAGNRKPIDGECPICVFDMEPGEDIVWCKAACGQNFHKDCFEQWRRSKHGGKVTCVYCRTEWQEDVPNGPNRPPPGSLANLKDMAPKVGSYKNVSHLMPQYSQDYG
ncbi:hypothetical protein LHYA1_G005607 [Lachnellula hyalina]|uniref:Postreplication repair E3 ubiquitin-protein ligase RAD18 n=1 Tax=Lachnellula hyalina TaxID=1316788 RepID=A0A8H8R1S7_9HELO|nr:uncharacterized protein LHYA1_G005607 [Lachnellula hyalina]TVY26491.1 hypothetical protein LHYA1_G005607 [Lachnellula hyalina]